MKLFGSSLVKMVHFLRGNISLLKKGLFLQYFNCFAIDGHLDGFYIFLPHFIIVKWTFWKWDVFKNRWHPTQHYLPPCSKLKTLSLTSSPLLPFLCFIILSFHQVIYCLWSFSDLTRVWGSFSVFFFYHLIPSS